MNKQKYLKGGLTETLTLKEALVESRGENMSNDSYNTLNAEVLIKQGFRRVSNSGLIVSRIDRHDWREYMARQHSPWDPSGDGMKWVFVLSRQAGSAEDHYRRCYSRCKLVLTKDIYDKIPSSNGDPVGYVNVSTFRQERTCQVQVQLFSLGDYVRTPDGVARVVEDEPVMLTEKDLRTTTVKVEYKHNTRRDEILAGVPVEVNHERLIMIEGIEYADEKE